MVPIPEGSETHSEESELTDYRDSQEELDQPTDLRGSGGWPSEQGAEVIPGKVSGACELSGI
jgi:hypothetical protein